MFEKHSGDFKEELRQFSTKKNKEFIDFVLLEREKLDQKYKKILKTIISNRLREEARTQQ